MRSPTRRATVEVARVAGRDGRRSGPGQTQRFTDGAHRRGGAHRVTGALAQGQCFFEFTPLVIVQLTLPTLVPQAPEIGAGTNATTLEVRDRSRSRHHDQTGHVGAEGAHQRARYGLIARGEDDDAVKWLRAHGLFEFHREEIAIEHRGRLHQVLAKRDDRELDGDATRRFDARAQRREVLGERLVAGIEITGGVGESDDRSPARGVHRGAAMFKATRLSRATSSSPRTHRSLRRVMARGLRCRPRRAWRSRGQPPRRRGTRGPGPRDEPSP